MPPGPNYSHGTPGVSFALAIAGTALNRPDFVDAARRGAQHLLAVGSLDDDGFIRPHTIPPTTSRVVEPVTYTWCHGPAGTSHLDGRGAVVVDRPDQWWAVPTQVRRSVREQTAGRTT